MRKKKKLIGTINTGPLKILIHDKNYLYLITFIFVLFLQYIQISALKSSTYDI